MKETVIFLKVLYCLAVALIVLSIWVNKNIMDWFNLGKLTNRGDRKADCWQDATKTIVRVAMSYILIASCIFIW